MAFLPPIRTTYTLSPILLFLSLLININTGGVICSPAALPVGVILPLSTEVESAKDIVVLLTLGKRYVEEKGILSTSRVHLSFTPEETFVLDDESRALFGLRHATTLALKLDVVLLLGAWNSAVSIQVATYAASAGLVQISGSSASPVLSEKQNYPSFLRTTSNSNMMMVAQLKTCQVFKWTRVAIITTDDAFGFTAATTFRDSAPEYDIRITSFQTVPFNIVRLNAQNTVRKALASIQASEPRVILLSGVVSDASPILTEARDMGMIGRGEYQWLSGIGWAMDNIGTVFEHPEIALGSIGVTTYVNTSTDLYQEVLPAFQAEHQSRYGIAKDAPESVTLGFFDAMLLYAKALNASVERFDELSISIDCLKPSKLTLPECLLPTQERDHIYASAVKNNYTGLAEYMLLMTDLSDKTQATGTSLPYGIHSRNPQALVLHEIYKQSFQGASNFIKLTSLGDTSGDLGIVNYQPVAPEKRSNFSRSKTLSAKWVVVGILFAQGNGEIEFNGNGYKPQFSGSTIDTPATNPVVFQTIIPPDRCDYADQSKYSFFENSSYAFQEYRSGVSLLLSLACLLLLSFAFGAVFSTRLIVKDAQEKASQESRQRKPSTLYDSLSKKGFPIYTTVVSNNSNNALVAMLIVEHIFILSLCLQPNLSWLDAQGSDNFVKSVLNFSFGNFLFFLNYFWVALLFLWCIYCLMYVFHTTHVISQYYAGELFLYPSIFYLRIVGTLGLLPIVTSLLRLFNCAYVDTISEAVLVRPYCEQRCFTSSHESILLISGLILILFVPLNLVTAHIWQELTAMKVISKERLLKSKVESLVDIEDYCKNNAICVVFRREYILLSQMTFLLVVTCIAFLKVYPYAFLCGIMLLLLLRAGVHILFLPLGRAVNVIWIDWLIRAQTTMGIGSSLICLVTHFLGVSSAWPLGLVFAWGGVVLVGWFVIVKQYYKLKGFPMYTDSLRTILAKDKANSKNYFERTSAARMTYLVSQLRGEQSSGSGNKVAPLSDQSSVEEAMSIRISDVSDLSAGDELQQVRHLFRKQSTYAQIALKRYFRAIGAERKDRAVLSEALATAIEFCNGLLSRSDRYISQSEVASNDEGELIEGGGHIRTSNISQVDVETFRFLGSTAALLRSRGIRLRTAFLRSVPCDLLGDNALNLQLLEGCANSSPSDIGVDLSTWHRRSMQSIGSQASTPNSLTEHSLDTSSSMSPSVAAPGTNANVDMVKSLNGQPKFC
eukprot:Nk52_evm2s216 gene=Nk52_evmTU2s216